MELLGGECHTSAWAERVDRPLQGNASDVRGGGRRVEFWKVGEGKSGCTERRRVTPANWLARTPARPHARSRRQRVFQESLLRLNKC